MSWQHVVVALLVVFCAFYVACKLIWATARQTVARQLLRIHSLPTIFKAALLRTTQAQTGCGACGSCGDKPNQAAQQVVTFHPRQKR
jgi:hypothetical protein